MLVVPCRSGRRLLSRSRPLNAAVLENFWERAEGVGTTPYGGYQWFETWHHKAARKIQGKLAYVDVVVEIRDARAPFSTYNAELEKLTSGKPRVVVFNKADLADRDSNKRLTEFYEKLGVPAILTNFSGISANDAKRLAALIVKNKPPTYLNTAPINCIVVGMPNVGKSSLCIALRKAFIDETTNIHGYRYKIQKRLSRKFASVGGAAGLTKKIGYVTIPVGDHSVTLIDTPGLLTPKVTNVRQSEKISVLGLADFSHQQGDENCEKVGNIVWQLVSQNGLESAVMAYFRMAYPPPLDFLDFKKRAVLTLDLLGKAAKKNLKNYTPKTYGQGMFAAFRRPVRKLITAFQKGEFGRLTIDEIPRIDDNNVVTAPKYIQDLYYSERNAREERQRILKMKRDDQSPTAEPDDTSEENPPSSSLDPQRIWNIKSRTVDITASEYTSKTPEAAQDLYKLDKVVDSLKQGNVPISRRAGPLKGDLREFDTDRIDDVRRMQAEKSNERNDAFSLLYDTQKRRRFKAYNMDRDKFPQVTNLIRIRNFTNPNPLNNFTSINILTGDLKSKDSSEMSREQAVRKVTIRKMA
eukprot:TRINITY_DN11192_c0_g1_i1.p1 TRINITY_DN11192_c0_g1~~TRINITY_DN11192_c0_g1_i1.p1  ORF type:complete len:581 (+),score=106.12 TRINITY_DN11192_c0_g1_i1:35-1777(+)